MKEKETKVQRFFFKEEWELGCYHYAQSKDPRIMGVSPNLRKIEAYHGNGVFQDEPMPVFLNEWIENNQQPTMHRDEFIHSLGERVLALEAALAEKGGLQ